MRSRKSHKRPIAIDLYCGAGGMSLGMEQAGFDIALAIDYDGYHAATHKRNFPYGRVKCASVADLDGREIGDMAGCDEEVDLVFGGPPCQGFSNMGLRDASDPRNSLIFHFARVVDGILPKAFVMENVTGLNMGATKSVFDAFITEVSDKYNVTLPVSVLNAQDFGVPQARKRLFVIGIRKDIGGTACYPQPSAKQKTPTVLEAIGDLPVVENDESLFVGDSAAYGCDVESSNKYALYARGISRRLNDFSHKRNRDKSVISGCQRVKHAATSVELYRSTAPGEIVPGHKLPRLHPDGICPTLRAGATSERGSHTAPRPIHPTVARVITAREAARLHGYPDWFGFYPAKMHAYRQIGNSVCPPVAHVVGLEVLKSLGIEPKLLHRGNIVLDENFDLPDDRPLQHSRIPVKVEYPKVINYLWKKAYNAKTRKLNKAEFGPKEIGVAIAATGAQLPRVRPERFLYEAQQQRAIRDILAIPLIEGYSIAIVDRKLGTGKFQKAEMGNSFGLPKAIVINSGDVNRAIRIGGKDSRILSTFDLFSLMENPEFVRFVSGGEWKSLKLIKDLFGEPELSPSRVVVTREDNIEELLHLELFDSSSVPFDRISRLLNIYTQKTAIIMLRLTNHHFAAVLIKNIDGKISEKRRVIFTNA